MSPIVDKQITEAPLHWRHEPTSYIKYLSLTPHVESLQYLHVGNQEGPCFCTMEQYRHYQCLVQVYFGVDTERAAFPYPLDLERIQHSVHGPQQLRSTASGTLLVPGTRTATGHRSFAVNGPRTWNSLSAELRTPDTTLCSFKRHLKAHLFQQ